MYLCLLFFEDSFFSVFESVLVCCMLSDGILCGVVLTASLSLSLSPQDEGTFQMKNGGRDALRRLGSTHAHELGWRDMWAMVAVKGGRVYGEQLAHSPDFNTWGSAVMLRAEVPLVPFEGEEGGGNKRRRRTEKGKGYRGTGAS